MFRVGVRVNVRVSVNVYVRVIFPNDRNTGRKKCQMTFREKKVA
jgi:hypothetical protein